ncbi:hypothetical protein BV898_01023 [Hypsibius exemplaris]|uniref:Transmembrane protein 11, mitochondrial n=1 Tax=Hypsibius exemplaris TaxID=2072580 RepID=A0A1W0XCY3_HYPEX|nr:hypothetical protein BV898_01023 [Hypsibius exemplaris]
MDLFRSGLKNADLQVGPLISFIVCEFFQRDLVHRECCLVEPHADYWRGCPPKDLPVSNRMADAVAKGPFIVVRDLPPRESPSSFSSISGNGDSDTGNGDSQMTHNNGNGNNGNGITWIFSELELAVEANPPYIIIDSLYADEIAKNIYRGNLLRLFSVVGSVASAAMSVDRHTLPVAVPTITMTIATAAFYGLCYMRDPGLRYTVLGRKWRVDGFQLSAEHFIFTDQQPPLILKAANSRFRKVLRVMPVVLPVVGAGIVLWRFWKILG